MQARGRQNLSIFSMKSLSSSKIYVFLTVSYWDKQVIDVSNFGNYRHLNKSARKTTGELILCNDGLMFTCTFHDVNSRFVLSTSRYIYFILFYFQSYHYYAIFSFLYNNYSISILYFLLIICPLILFLHKPCSCFAKDTFINNRLKDYIIL